MSLVTVVANNRFLTLMTDGRITYIFEDGTSQPEGESTQKFFTIGNDYFCAYAGYEECFTKFIELAKLNNPDRNELEVFAKEVYKKFENLEDIEKNMSIVFGGKNKEGIIKFFSLNKSNVDIEESMPKNGEYKYAILNSPNVKHSDIEKKLWELNDLYCPATPEAMLFVQKELNKYVASIDNTVNNNTFHYIINK